MSNLARRPAPARATALVAALLASCNQAPSPSHVGQGYRGRLTDDVLLEASTTVLVTTKAAVVAIDCAPLRGADDGAVDRAVGNGVAFRVPAGVTLYTPPFSPENPKAGPVVVTDDKAAGRLCTAGAYRVLKS